MKSQRDRRTIIIVVQSVVIVIQTGVIIFLALLARWASQ